MHSVPSHSRSIYVFRRNCMMDEIRARTVYKHMLYFNRMNRSWMQHECAMQTNSIFGHMSGVKRMVRICSTKKKEHGMHLVVIILFTWKQAPAVVCVREHLASMQTLCYIYPNICVNFELILTQCTKQDEKKTQTHKHTPKYCLKNNEHTAYNF